ncbi:MAG TPA: BON domain-containing protein [Gemmatimonadaceae bacterium]|nr:BON domain-containing protein [Gemmatimonadaceae bacterium]
MERDYEDIRDTDDLSDNELRALVRDTFDQQLAFDPDDVQIGVRSGVVTLAGRVGTEEEFRIIERVVTDLVGLKNLNNGIVVDPIRRAESPEAIDEHLVDEEMHEGLLLGDMPRPEDPEAEHLHQNLKSELFGTTDVQSSIANGIPWNPPNAPTPEGVSGQDASPNVMNDEH